MLDSVDLDLLSRLIRDKGRPVHINTLAHTAVHSWLEVSADQRHYAPSAQYQAGANILLNGQPVTVKSVQEASNPVQGSFSILTLLFPDGTERLMAAGISGAPSEERQAVTEAQVDEILRTHAQETRQAVQAALGADLHFVSCQTLQGDLWCLTEILPSVNQAELQKALAALSRKPEAKEPISLTTEELAKCVWGLEDDGSDEYALYAFALSQALNEHDDVVCLGSCWASAQTWEIFTSRPALETPRMPTQITLPEDVPGAEVALIEEEQRRETVGEGEVTEAEEKPESDLETWRRDRPTHAVLILRARHYYEGWLPLDKQLRQLFPPLASGRQRVTFYHHFGDESASFAAYVDRAQRRLWVSPEMYAIFRHHRIYPGARLRVSARNEREFDIATRGTDKTDPIHVWRMWLDERGVIQYEDHEEPRLYDIDDDVYVADVRFEDREALLRQAEETGNSIFGLMYQKAVEWWESDGRKELTVTADRLFEAIHFDEHGRATSKATIAWELWKRLAFEAVGGGRYRFRPEFADHARSARTVSPRRRTGQVSPQAPSVGTSVSAASVEQTGFFIFQQRPDSEYADRVGVVYNWRQGIPGSKQIAEGARFVYYRPGERVFFGTGRVASIESYVEEDGVTYYDGHITNYEPWDPPLPLTSDLASRLSFIRSERTGVGTAGIRKISQQDFEIVVDAHRQGTERVLEFWEQIAQLAGRRLQTLGEGAAFEVLHVDDSAAHIKVASSGHIYSVYRRELEGSWTALTRQGNLRQTAIRDGLGYPNPTYVAAILAALPSVTHQDKPIRLTYAPKEATAQPPAAKPTIPRGPETVRPVSKFWTQVAQLAGQELRTLGQGKRFRLLRVDDDSLRIQMEESGESWPIPRRKLEAAWLHLVREGELSSKDIRARGYIQFNSTYGAAILAALPGVTYKTRPIRLICAPRETAAQPPRAQLPAKEPAGPSTRPTAALERTRADQLIATDLVTPSPLFEGTTASTPPAESAPPDVEAEFRQIQQIIQTSLVGKTIHTLTLGRPNRIAAADAAGLTIATERGLGFVYWKWIQCVHAALYQLRRIEVRDVQKGEHCPHGVYRCAFIFPLLAQFSHIETHAKPRTLIYRKPDGVIRLRDAASPVDERSVPPPESSTRRQEDTMHRRRSASGTEPLLLDLPGEPPMPPSPPFTPPDDALRDLRDAARAIAEGVEGTRLDEREVVTLFFQQGFFDALGYGAVGEDIRLEQRVARGRADVVLRAFTGRPVALIEFKRPTVTDLNAHVPQLAEYATDLFPAVAALTNGQTLWLYRVVEGELTQPPTRYNLAELTSGQVAELYRMLRRRDVDWRSLTDVREALARCQAEPIRVTAPDQAGGRQFLQRFALDERSPFGRLTKALAENLPTLIERSDFTQGAYTFWKQAYARELSQQEAPESWRSLIIGEGNEALYRFMFALETAYTLLSRILLLKAMSDTGFPDMNAVATFEHALILRQAHLRISPANYIEAIQDVFEAAGRQAFQSLFASDIFDWWQDATILPDLASLTETLAEATVAVFDFNFGALQGDLLGVLYQSYFDPDTRKALGEFYTPPEVVDFILDQVEYRGPAVRTQRLLDPACGSGTFLVHALRRHLEASAGHDPVATLRNLVDGLRIVGFDINPFAVLMAQINYAAQILPIYAQAIQQQPGFALVTLPVFRTDSLRQEVQEQETGAEDQDVGEGARQLGMTLVYEGGVAYIRADLPVRIGRDRFLEVRVPVPQFAQARTLGLVDNVERYFCALRAVFAAVREGRVAEKALANRLQGEGLARADELANYVADAAHQIGGTLERLRNEYQDGRFLKTLEDLALALLLKSDFQYDYVVGNPPYVRIQNIPEMLRRDWAGLYDWAEGSYDIYIPFFERAITQWLREGGRLGFICSDRFMLANYAENLREQLPENADVELLFDMRDTRVFKDALNYPAIIVTRRASLPTQADFPVARAFSDPEGGPKPLLDEATELIDRVHRGDNYVLGEYVDAFPETRDHLVHQAWYLMPDHERAVFEALITAGTHHLEELTLTGSGAFQGISTGLNEVFVLRLLEERGDVLQLMPKGGEAPVEIERAVLRPWLFGRDVERWHIAWDRWYVLFPYLRIEGQYALIPSSEYRHHFDHAGRADYSGPFIDQTYPLCWRYLQGHERSMRQRLGGAFARGKPQEPSWYAYSAARNLEWAVQPKVLLQSLSPESDVAFDEEGRYLFVVGGGGGVYGVAPDTELLPPQLLTTLLNSAPLEFYLRHCAFVFGGHAYERSDHFIKHLPIRLPQNSKEEDIAARLTVLARELTNTKDQLRRMEREGTLFPAPLLPELGSVELYPLRQLIAGTPQAQNIRVEDASFQPQLDGQWAMMFGRTTFLFPSEAHARLAETWLQLQGRATVRTDDLLAIRVPASAEDCHRLLELLETQEGNIEELEATISDGESEVDALVAELYGVDGEPMQVIEEFLERF